MKALLYLLRRSGRNRIVRTVGRLRNPKYAVGALVGAAYLVLVFLPSFADSGSTVLNVSLESAVRTVLPLLVFFLAAWWWLFGGSKFVLAFSPAEVQLLFTAPLSRRRLLLYRVMRAQGPLVFTAMIWAVVFRFGTLELPLRFLSLWTILGVLHLHQMAAHLTRTSVERGGARALLTSGLPLLVAFGGLGVMGWVFLTQLAALMSPPPGSGFLAELGRVVTTQPASAILAPFRILIAPLFTESGIDWALAVVPILLIGLVHVLWVVQTGVAFEEQAAAAGIARQNARKAVLQGRWSRASAKKRKARTRSASLRPQGVHVMAILWKNWYGFFRNLGGRQFVLIVIVVGSVLGALMANEGGDGPLMDAVVFLALFGTGLSMIMGSQFLRNDLRADLVNIEVLRTYPVHSGALVGAELASSAIILFLIQIILIVIAGTLGPFTEFLGPRPTLVWRYAIPGILILPALNMITVGAANSVAVLFPGWVQLGPQVTVGVQALGQRLVNVFALLIVTVVALVPAALLTGAVLFVLQPLGVWATLAGFLVLLAVLWAEVVLISLAIAWAYNRLDPVEAGLLN